MTKEVKVGLFAAISGAVLYFGFNFLKGKDFFSNNKKYYALYDNIDGLNVSNPVIVNGYAVGRVSDIEILQDQNNKVIIEMDVKGNLIVGVGSTAVLTNSDFLGSKSIVLEIKNIKQPIESGDTIQGTIDHGIADILEPLNDNVSITISRLNDILNGMKGSGVDIKHTLENLNKTVIHVNKLVAQNNVKLKNTFDNLNMVLVNVDQKVDQIEPIFNKADSTLYKINELKLAQTLNTLDQTLVEFQSVLKNINEGNGTLGRIINEDSLYNNLNKTIEDLDRLIIHFDENPKHFLSPLGKSAKKIKRDRQNSE